MILKMHSSQTITDIRNQFSANYPFLNIEFYTESHELGETTSCRHLISHETLIGEILGRRGPDYFEIPAWQKTGIIEQEFQNLYGLNAQIHRLMGDKWIQTAGTDDLTLEEQNEIGRNSNRELIYGGKRFF
ncbi:MAG: hypothetical protein JST10_11850 [Bacteroidetes bacterium]|nr:hypothetical protein [Bacteroidota bacterium]